MSSTWGFDVCGTIWGTTRICQVARVTTGADPLPMPTCPVQPQCSAHPGNAKAFAGNGLRRFCHGPVELGSLGRIRGGANRSVLQPGLRCAPRSGLGRNCRWLNAAQWHCRFSRRFAGNCVQDGPPAQLRRLASGGSRRRIRTRSLLGPGRRARYREDAGRNRRSGCRARRTRRPTRCRGCPPRTGA